MKQTAVKWLQEQLKKGIDFNPLDSNSYLNEVESLFEKAKAMEKEQIMEAHYDGQCDNREGYPIEISKEYYNETYEKL